ncbi:hypothetical protein BN1723_020548, partial [Verticillium longisporum]
GRLRHVRRGAHCLHPARHGGNSRPRSRGELDGQLGEALLGARRAPRRVMGRAHCAAAAAVPAGVLPHRVQHGLHRRAHELHALVGV